MLKDRRKKLSLNASVRSSLMFFIGSKWGFTHSLSFRFFLFRIHSCVAVKKRRKFSRDQTWPSCVAILNGETQWRRVDLKSSRECRNCCLATAIVTALWINSARGTSSDWRMASILCHRLASQRCQRSYRPQKCFCTFFMLEAGAVPLVFIFDSQMNETALLKANILLEIGHSSMQSSLRSRSLATIHACWAKKRVCGAGRIEREWRYAKRRKKQSGEETLDFPWKIASLLNRNESSGEFSQKAIG